ncbi:hypothetical protein [Hymenobacter guriensis]|uniref:Uncharacterized protein n=1 Tax=Hymenobacter guriensis TaxID=2793065 RepID=A0ABS0L0C2_9BACT|nr:hypothetical protein [Hymenobacter guriensis]MBG8552842.1 hypothetical protein [Hymenobacter guriensis]
MHKLSFKLPMIDDKLLSFEILTGHRWTSSIESATPCEVLEDADGENLTLYLSDEGICYGQLNSFNSFDFDESEPDWDEGFDQKRQLSPVTRYGYAFHSVDDAHNFWEHIRNTWHDQSTAYGFVRLNPSEQKQLLQGKSAAKITEQYNIEGWESLQLTDGRVLLKNSHRTDKAHASLFNTLADYLIDKKANDDFLDFINRQKD